MYQKILFVSLYLLYACLSVAQSKTDYSKIANKFNIDKIDSSRFFFSCQELPHCFVQQLSVLLQDSFVIASATDIFRKSDEITDVTDGLPTRRLIWGIRDTNHITLYYEQGGRGYSLRLVTAKITRHQVQSLYSIIFFPPRGEDKKSIQYVKNVLHHRNFFIGYNNGKKLKRRFVPF
jgi:hypothetical protein